MPLNPLDNMPEALRRHSIAAHKFSLSSKEPQTNGNLNLGGPMMFVSSGHLEKVPIPMNTMGMHGKVRMLAKYLVYFFSNSKLCLGIKIPFC